MDKRKYHDYNSCQMCSRVNIVTITDKDENHVLECYTKCTHCNNEDFWAYGWFEPSITPS